MYTSKKRMSIALVGMILVLAGNPGGALSDECSPDEALLWLRLGMAIGQNSEPPTRDELTGLLESINRQPPPAFFHPDIPETVDAISSTDITQGNGETTKPGSIETETFWIRLGWPEVPVIYMVIDPTCPYCSIGLQKLAPQISSNHLQVRIVLVPFLNEMSAPLAADLILADNPADAIWEHEIIHQGQADWEALDPNILEELGPKGRGWLQTNLEWMQRQGLNSVPLYVWAEADGNDITWQIRSGVQEPDTFQAALPPVVPSKTGFGLPDRQEVVGDIEGISSLPRLEPLPLD